MRPGFAFSVSVGDRGMGVQQILEPNPPEELVAPVLRLARAFLLPAGSDGQTSEQTRALPGARRWARGPTFACPGARQSLRGDPHEHLARHAHAGRVRI